MTWGYSEATGEFGLFTVWVWDSWVSDATRVPYDLEVTHFRDVPIQIDDLQYQDPFSDAIATLTFPQITGHDTFGPGGTVPWMKSYENVDVYFLPATVASWESFHGYPESQILNPLTNNSYLYIHEYGVDGERIKPIWEGFFSGITPSTSGTTVLCKGALYQVDRYHSKPLNPLRPKPVEQLIGRYFDPTRRGLWTQPLEVDYVGSQFTRTYTQWDHDRLYAQGGTRFTPTAPYNASYGLVPVGGDEYEMQLGHPWTTSLTRQTGNWDKALTGYVQAMLAMMYASPDSELRDGEDSWGVNIEQGDQWTIRKDPGRLPVMYLRRQFDGPTIKLRYGSPGVTDNLTQDGEQQYSVVFGQGVGPDGIAWNEMVPLGDASFLTWAPLYPEEAEDSLYVGWERGNNLLENYDGYAAERERAEGQVVVERYISDFPSGVDEEDGRRIAKAWAVRDSTAGWSGTITIDIDALDMDDNQVSKWNIRPGAVVFLQGFQGLETVAQGVNKFFVNRVVMKPMTGTVELQVDTKYRDALTIEHAEAAKKDTLSVVYANRVGQMMNQIQDLAAPWSANKGAGVMPTTSHTAWTRTESYPYLDFTTTVGNRPQDCFRPAFRDDGSGFSGGSHQTIKVIETDRGAVAPETALTLQNAVQRDAPGATYGSPADLRARGLYIPVQAGSAEKNRRWAFFPVLLANAGQIYRTEFAAYNEDGTLCENVEFHVSMYPVKVQQSDMPRDDLDPYNAYALWDGAFEPVQRNGLPWPDGEADRHAGHPNLRVGWGTFDRPCGYSPTTKDPDDPNPTGQFVDGGPWDFDMQGNGDWNPNEWNAPADITSAAISWWVAIYAQIVGFEETGDPTDVTGSNWVYFRGRAYRSVSIGTGS